MEVEIDFVGRSNKWVVNQPLIRIGSGAKCDVGLPAKQFPSVAFEHIALEVLRDSIRLASGIGSFRDTYINDHPAVEGAAIQSGDVLRLGAGGPELRVRFQEHSSRSPQRGYDPTRLMRANEAPAYEPTRIVPVPGLVADSENRRPSAGMAGNKPPVHQSSSVAAPTVDAHYSSFAPSATSGSNGGLHPVDRNDRGHENGKPRLKQETLPASPQPIPGVRTDNENQGRLEAKLKLMQSTQFATLSILVVLLVWIFLLNRQLSQTQDEVHALRGQAQSAVSQFTPALDEKLGSFEKQIGGLDSKLRDSEVHMEADMDAKMRLAQEEMFSNIDKKMKATEDRMVNRMNTEIPSMLDKYIDQKLSGFKH